jgi:hypothetical protein
MIGSLKMEKTMQMIHHFKHIGGKIVWDECGGIRASWVGEPKIFLLEQSTNEVYRCSDDEWNQPPRGFVRAKGFLG